MEVRRARLLTGVLPRVESGQIWRERAAPGAPRYNVVLLTFADGRIWVQRCQPDGSDVFVGRGKTRTPAPSVEIHIARFVDAGRAGFTLVRDVVRVAA